MPTLAEEFQAFWARYPRRVSRQDAMKAYQQARVMATAEEILAGVESFLAHLPEEMRFVPYAASWLRASRWTDEYDEVLPVKVAADANWFDECRRIHNGECEGDRMRHHVRIGIDKSRAS